MHCSHSPFAPTAALLLAAWLTAPDASAQAPAETPRTATLRPVGPHDLWITDSLFAHSQLFDGDSGEALATIDAGSTLSPKPPLHSRRRGEFYGVEIDYARGTRGARSDYITIYDTRTLAVKGEIVLPTRSSESATSIAYAALLDDERFLATFNQFPLASVSIVDLEDRRFVGEIPIAGCAGIYPAGERRFASLCGNGSVLLVELGDQGRKRSSSESRSFFDVVDDPVMMAGARVGTHWIFVSFAGHAYEVDVSTSPPTVDTWPLIEERDRERGWRPGGKQHLAAHASSGRLYTIVHKGGPGTHKDAGPEVWVHSLEARERVARFAMPNFNAAFLGRMMEVESGLGAWLLERVLPGGGAHTIAVTQDDAPLLFARNADLGVAAVLDARTGEHLRTIDEIGLSGNRMEVP